MLIPYSKNHTKLPSFSKLICADDFSKYTAVGVDLNGKTSWAPPVDKSDVLNLQPDVGPFNAVVKMGFSEDLLMKYISTGKPYLLLDLDTNTLGFTTNLPSKLSLNEKKMFQSHCKDFGMKVTLQKFQDLSNPSVDLNLKLEFIEWWWEQYKKFTNKQTFNNMSTYLDELAALAPKPKMKLQPKYSWVLKDNVLTHTEA